MCVCVYVFNEVDGGEGGIGLISWQLVVSCIASMVSEMDRLGLQKAHYLCVMYLTDSAGTELWTLGFFQLILDRFDFFKSILIQYSDAIQ